MGHGVNVTEVGVIESHSRQQGSVGHVFAGLQVAAQRDGLAQVPGDQADGLDRGGIGDRVGIFGNIGLHGVG